VEANRLALTNTTANTSRLRDIFDFIVCFRLLTSSFLPPATSSLGRATR
jgi:hypothetical protein